jgi:hypothetical protein
VPAKVFTAISRRPSAITSPRPRRRRHRASPDLVRRAPGGSLLRGWWRVMRSCQGAHVVLEPDDIKVADGERTERIDNALTAGQCRSEPDGFGCRGPYRFARDHVSAASDESEQRPTRDAGSSTAAPLKSGRLDRPRVRARDGRAARAMVTDAQSSAIADGSERELIVLRDARARPSGRRPARSGHSLDARERQRASVTCGSGCQSAGWRAP